MIHVPSEFCGDVDPSLELAQASARYGDPVVREVTLEVSKDTIDYWLRVRNRRVAEAVLVIPDGTDRYLVHTKAFYPQGAYRLLSGGIKAGESLLDAASREALEETAQRLAPTQFLGIIWTTFVHDAARVRFTSYLLELDSPSEAVHSLDAKEQITDYRFVSLTELATLANELEELDPEWIDWGRFRAVGHRLAIECLRTT